MDGETIFRIFIWVIIVILYILPILVMLSDKEGVTGTDSNMPDKKDKASKEETAADND